MSDVRKVWPGPLKGNTKTVIVDERYYAQLRDAEQWLIHRHQQLIEAGFKWDGQDGYEAPHGMTVEQMQEFLK